MKKWMTGGDLLVECLKTQGVGCIFGMPGSENIQIYDSLYRCGGGVIKHYLVRHEYAATKMADGFARATGEVGVALTVPGPGASNASTGILEAFTDCVPVLLITGQSDSKWAHKDPAKMAHGLDQMTFFKPITKFQARPESVADIPKIVAEAFGAMRSGRPGPVFLEFPLDVLIDTAEVAISPRVERTPGTPPDETALRAAVEALNRAKMPVIVAGSNVIHSQAQEQLRCLAEKLNAPVCTTRNAKGALPEDHPLALSHMVGFSAQEALKRADCTLALGTRFASLDTQYWSMVLPKPLIQLDEDPGELGREYPTDVGVAGDLRLALIALLERVRAGADSWRPVIDNLRSEFAMQAELPLLGELRSVLPENGILVVDCHALGYATFTEYPVSDHKTYLYPNIGCSLGYAFPAALGAKVAHPDRRVVSFSGDAGFMMAACELATAVKYNINMVAVVVNDAALSSIKGTQQKLCNGRIIEVDLVNPDFVKFVEAFGAYGKRVDDPSNFQEILEEAFCQNRPAVIEVPMSEKQAELIESIGWLRSEPLRKAESIW